MHVTVKNASYPSGIFKEYFIPAQIDVTTYPISCVRIVKSSEVSEREAYESSQGFHGVLLRMK